MIYDRILGDERIADEIEGNSVGPVDHRVVEDTAVRGGTYEMDPHSIVLEFIVCDGSMFGGVLS